jgi:hypothetical protein
MDGKRLNLSTILLKTFKMSNYLANLGAADQISNLTFYLAELT